MAQVVVVEFDELLRGALHDILSLNGDYEVTEVADEAVALAYLAATPGGMVAVCSNRDADHHRSAAFFAVVAADERLATRHRYIMLSTSPERMPVGLQVDLARLRAAILGKPFDLDTLLATVRTAALRLVPLPTSGVRRPSRRHSPDRK